MLWSLAVIPVIIIYIFLLVDNILLTGISGTLKYINIRVEEIKII